jgi:hypothetical protein
MKMMNTTTTEQIAQARGRIADALLEVDDIKLQVNPRIEAEYATKIGYLENALLKWQIAARRARRRFTLAQARANAGAAVAADEFEAQLDEELAEWNRLLAQSVESFLKAAERLSGSRPLSPGESSELKQLHRELIKRLHPDLHPGQSCEEARFFMVAQAAYEQGNLEMLRSIAVATEGMGAEPDDSTLTEDEASIELELVLAHERVTASQLEDLKRSNPYALKEKLEDGEAYGMVLRAKGMLPDPDGMVWHYFDMVPGEHELREGAPEYTGRLCVIGSKLNEDALAKLFGLA